MIWAFLHDFDQKQVSSERRVCFGTWSQKNHFQAVLNTL